MTYLKKMRLLVLLLAPLVYAGLPEIDINQIPKTAREPLSALQKLLADEQKSLSVEARAELVGQLGMVLHSAEQYALAADYYREAMRQAPDDARWYYLYGVVQFARGNLDSAYAALRMSFDRKSDYLPTLARIAEIALQKGDNDEVRRIAELLSKEKAFSAYAHELLGQVAAARNQPGVAVEHFRKVLALQPFASRVYYPLAIQLRKLGRIEEARQLLTRRGDVAPVYPDPLMQMVRRLVPTPERLLEEGLALAKAGKLAKAAEKYQEGLKLAPKHPALNTALAYIELQRGDVAAAKKRLEDVLGTHKDYVPARLKLAEIADATGALSEAIKAYRSVLSSEPDNTDAMAGLGALLMRSGKFKESAVLFDRYVQFKPENAQAHFFAGLSWLAAGECHNGLARLERAQQLKPTDGGVTLALSVALVECDKDKGERARKLAQAVYEAAPGLESARVLAWHQARAGQWQDAVDYQTQAIFEMLKRGAQTRYPELSEQLKAYRQNKAIDWDWQSYARQWAPGSPQLRKQEQKD